MSKRIVIIGAGPAGEAAAKTIRRLCASTSPSITILEKESLGGLCLNKGCVPSKTLLEEVHKRMNPNQPIPWEKLQERKQLIVQSLRSQLENSFKTLKIDLVQGMGSFASESSISIKNSSGAKVIVFDKAIIATGTESFFPPPLDEVQDELLDSDKILNITQTPRSLVIIGGGAVGCEFACLLNAAGTDVVLVEMCPTLLPGEDPAIVQALTKSFEDRGIKIKTNTQVQKIKKTATGWTITLSNGESLSSEKVLVCVGRVPNLGCLDLKKASINTNQGRINLNDKLQTSNPAIYVAGDAGNTRLAHAAAAQGEVAATNAWGGSITFDDRFVPRCLYTWPEVASVGVWKYQREEKDLPVKTSRAFFRGSAKGLAANEAEGFVQIVSDPTSDQILGAQIIGAQATELIHIFSVALKKDLTTKELGEVIFAHPTMAEVLREAARR